MFARITVQSGIAEGTSHVIEGRVARVGSDPQADICLPTNDIPAHALTLEFRGEGCLVYNRCPNSVFIGSQTVEPDNVVQWAETDLLQMGSETTLLLDFDWEAESEESDSQNSESGESFPSDIVGGAIDSDKKNQATAKDKSSSTKTVVQLLVIVACVAGSALLLLRDQNQSKVQSGGLNFSQLISVSLDDESVSDELLRRLQFAETQRVRGREEAAHLAFQGIRDDLLYQFTSDLDAENLPENRNSEILQFVQKRLADD